MPSGVYERLHRPWNKGLSKETNDSIKKMSDSKKGQKSWNKNLTKENDERVKKMSDARKGIIFSNSHLDNLRQSHIGLKYPNRIKSNSSAWNTGLTKETDDRVAKYSKKISAKTKGQSRKPHSDKTRKKQSIAGKRKWNNPEYVKLMMKKLHVTQNKAESALEKILNDILPYEYKFVGNGGCIIHSKRPDFTNINGQKKLIELYGDYWHRNDNPQDRIDLFAQYGYDTLVIWERELKDIATLKYNILTFHNKA